MKLIVKVLPLQTGPANALYGRVIPAEPKSFLLPVKPGEKFAQVWTRAEQRYRENYIEGRRNDYMFKKLQDAHNNDIDLRDSVDEIFNVHTDFQKCVIQVVQAHIDREISIPYGSNLQPPQTHKRRLTIAQTEDSKRRRIEEENYGTTVESLDPDQPIMSTEPEPAGRAEMTPNAIDGDGFKIPKKPTRALSLPRSVKGANASAIRTSSVRELTADAIEDSQMSQEQALPHSSGGRSGSKAASESGNEPQSSPVASKPQLQLVRQASTAEQGPADDYQALGSSSNSPQPDWDSSDPPEPTSSHQRLSVKRWTNEEKDVLLAAIEEKMSSSEIHATHFAYRSMSSVQHQYDRFKAKPPATKVAPGSTIGIGEYCAQSSPPPMTLTSPEITLSQERPGQGKIPITRRSVSFHEVDDRIDDVASASHSSPAEARKVQPTSILKRRSSPEVVIHKGVEQHSSPSRDVAQPQFAETPAMVKAFLDPPHVKKSPFKASYASRPGDVVKRASTQPSASKTPAVRSSRNAKRKSSSPLPEMRPSARKPILTYSQKKQTTLPFFRDKGKGRANRAPARDALRGYKAKMAIAAEEDVSDHGTIDISSDSSEESFFDSEIDEDELRDLAEKSSEHFRSMAAAGNPVSDVPQALMGSGSIHMIPDTQESLGQNAASGAASLPTGSNVNGTGATFPGRFQENIAVVHQKQRRASSPDEAGAQLLREARAAYGIVDAYTDDAGSIVSSSVFVQRNEALNHARLQQWKREEEALRAEQKPRHEAFLRRMKREEEERKIVQNAIRRRAQPNWTKLSRLGADAQVENENPAASSLEEHFRDTESADEEIDRGNRTDNDIRRAATENGLIPSSSPPELPYSALSQAPQRFETIAHGTQSTVRTADLAPPFPSSGKVRSPTPSQPGHQSSIATEDSNAMISPDSMQHKASSATSISAEGVAKGEKTTADRLGNRERSSQSIDMRLKTPKAEEKRKSFSKTPSKTNMVPSASAPAATTMHTPAAGSFPVGTVSSGRLPSHKLRRGLNIKEPAAMRAMKSLAASTAQTNTHGPRATMVREEIARALRAGKTEDEAQALAEEKASGLFGTKPSTK